MRSTGGQHQANERKNGLEAERVRYLDALCCLRSKKKLAAGKRDETQFVSNEEKEKWIEDYVDIETSVAIKLVEDAETAIELEQEDMSNAEKAGLTTTKPETTFEEMLNAIGNNLSDLACSDNGENGEDEDDDDQHPELGKQSDDDTPSWVMGRISKPVGYRMECF